MSGTADKYAEHLANPALQPAIDTIKIATLQNENTRLTERVRDLESELAAGNHLCATRQDRINELESRLAQAEGLLKNMEWSEERHTTFGPDGIPLNLIFCCPICHVAREDGHEFNCRLAAFLHPEQENGHD